MSRDRPTARRAHGWLAPAGLALLVWVGGAAGPRAAGPDRVAGEYQVKAAYLFNFAKFVEWPASAFSSADAPLVIGIYGRDPFGPVLEGLVKDKKLAGHPFVIRRSSSMADLRSSHLVFVGASSPESLSAILAPLSGAPILTVGEHERFIENGGVIRLDVDDGRVGFTIDVGAASRAQLSISSQLLRLARVTGQSRR